MITDQKEINNVFREFYEDLYRSEGLMDINKARIFFKHLNLPKLTEDNMRALECTITLEELTKTIELMPSGKTQGIDLANSIRSLWRCSVLKF